MRYEIIQNEIHKQGFLLETEKKLMSKKNLLKEIEKRLVDLKIENNQEIKREINTICQVLSDRYRKMVEYKTIEIKKTDIIFYRLFMEYKKDKFVSFDKLLNKRKLKYQINIKRGIPKKNAQLISLQLISNLLSRMMKKKKFYKELLIF